MQELQRLPNTLTDDEVAVAREAHLRALEIDAETPAALCALDVADLLEHGRRFDLARARQEVISVTTEAVRELAVRVLQPELMAVAVCGPEELGKQVA